MHKNVVVPRDFSWKLLSKCAALADRFCFTEYGRTCVNKAIAIIRSRNLSDYITFCKSDLSLQMLNIQYPAPQIVGERTLQEIRALRLLTCFQKYGFFTGSDPDQRRIRAFQKFVSSEHTCKDINENCPLFSDKDATHNFRGMTPTFLDQEIFPLVNKMKFYIRSCLGRFPKTRAFNQRHNGPGAAVGCHGSKATEISKCVYPQSINRSCLSLFGSSFISELFSHSELSSNQHLSSQLPIRTGSYPVISALFSSAEYSELDFVPKDAEIDRTISVEPVCNVSLQLGIADIMSKKIKRYFSIDLRSQNHNQELARIGSINQQLVTIDLESASDTVSLRLLNLLPTDWAEAIFRIRSHSWKNKEFGTSVFHKISSMGNGVTFPLETLIFTAACKAVFSACRIKWEKQSVAVYGDDIIVPQKAYSLLRSLLKSLGFSINKKKSFSTGFIRESCGHDYFHGHRIDRFTVKKDLSESLNRVSLHNKFFNFFEVYKMSSDICDDILFFIQRYIPQNFLNFGPYDVDHMSSWIFSHLPRKRPFFHPDYQAWFYKVRRNEKYHPDNVGLSTKMVPTLFIDSDGELPFMVWKAFEYFVPPPLENWKLSFFFRTSGAQNLGSSQLVDFCNIEGYSSAIRSTYCIKNVDAVRQAAYLIPFHKWEGMVLKI